MKKLKTVTGGKAMTGQQEGLLHARACSVACASSPLL